MKKLLLNTTAIALLSFISFQIILYIESYISSEVGATDFGQYKFVIRLIHFLSHVLLVGQDEHCSGSELLVSHHLFKLSLGIGQPVLVGGVDDENDALRACKVVTPKLTQLVLPANVPYVHVESLNSNSLHIEPDSWDGVQRLAGVQAKQQCGLARGI